jgi:hypothetical protein
MQFTYPNERGLLQNTIVPSVHIHHMLIVGYHGNDGVRFLCYFSGTVGDFGPQLLQLERGCRCHIVNDQLVALEKCKFNKV